MANKGTWPNLFIIGEPRSGTTTLHDWLSQHPDIFMSQVKEPHYFSSIEFPKIERDILHITSDKAKYQALFEEGTSKTYRGESSTYYLADPQAPKRIKDAAPEAKLIAIFRDPIERAFSHYLLYNRRGTQKMSFHETVQNNLQEEKNGKANLAYNLVELGRYHKHLQNYLHNFKKDQVLVLFSDEMHKDPKKTMTKVFEFLGIDAGVTEDLRLGEARNAYTRPRNKLSGVLLSSKLLMSAGLKLVPRPLLRQIREILLKQGDKPAVEPETKALLSKIYDKEIVGLEKVISRDCSSLRKTWS